MKRRPRRKPPATSREKLDAETNEYLRQHGCEDLADLGERDGKGQGEIVIREDLKQRSLETTITVTEANASEPFVPASESERYAKIARALKIPSRTVRETCQSLKRFIRSETYKDRLDKLRSGKSWMRRPELARPASFVTSGRVGKRHGPWQRLPFVPCPPGAPGAESFRVTSYPEAVEWFWNRGPYGREPQALRFRARPQAMLQFQERIYVIEDSFGAWLLLQRPKMRRANLHRARQIALWYIFESSRVERLPADN